MIPRYAPAWSFGGGVRFCYDLDAALIRRGFAVTVCTSDQLDTHRRAPVAREVLDGIDISRFANPSNYLASRMPWISYYPAGLRRAIVEQARRCHVIHVAEARGPHVRWAFEAARAAGVPIVWSPFGGLADGLGIRRPYRRLYDVVHRTHRLVAESHMLVAQTPHEARVLGRLGAQPEQVRVIGLGIDAQRFRELPRPGEFRRQAGIAPDRPLVLFMGRFHPSKGLDVLLKATAIVRRTRHDLALALVGWDHGALRMMRRLSRRLGLEGAVKVVPPLFGNAAVQAYVDADIFAMPVRLYEETSLAAMEALAAGTPCVLSRQCEVPDLEAMGGGRVVDCEPAAFAAGLHAVLTDPDRKTAALNARREILASHSAARVADAYATLFHQMVGRQTVKRAALPVERSLAQ